MSDAATTPGRLAGRRIIVTGAASGMGESIARRFVEEGARLALLDIDESGLARVGTELGQLTARLDVCDRAAVVSSVNTAALELGGIDGVVNAAGILAEGPVSEIDPLAVDRLVNVNLLGPLAVCQAAFPHLMQAAKATVVNIASMAALRPVMNMAVYSATKAGVLAMSHSMAYEWGPRIRVNVICPGFIVTPMTQYLLEPGNPVADTMAARHALQRAGEANEIADGALFLTSDESSYVTRTELAIHGGSHR